MQDKLRCAVYTRVSTDNQAEVEFNSCEAQEAKIKSFIKSQENMEVFQIYSDPGYTGANCNRPALNQLLNDIKEHKINLVISYKIDRLTRSPRDFYQLIEMFDKYKVDFISVTERFDTSTPSGRLLRNTMLTFAQFERELTSERTKDKMMERANKGMWNGGNVPFGYANINKKLVPHSQKSQKLQNVFEIFIETKSLSKTYRFLKSQKIFNNKGITFSKSSIQSILQNITYTGKLKYAGTTYQGTHKPLISEELFNHAQALLKQKEKKSRLYKYYILGGLVKCKECGSTMTPCHTNKIRKEKRKQYYYYRCTNTFKKEWDNCDTRQVSADRLDEYIIENLKRISLDRHYVDSLIFMINNSNSGGRAGLEPTDVSSRISPETFSDTLQSFVKKLDKIKGVEQNFWAKKFIKKHRLFQRRNHHKAIL